ncbi:flagellar protein FlaG [Candidatus Nitrotoga sp. AM1P]|uniref:flagellar protein FlaG n=1 Tax=Candidatus Nitrotoga sp. AM1P TaxID=2559597 RepID=UPI0010B9DC4E|nr:flagellar protein FlaG [Candidatus Nitrotoga sp. AM1P]BBJ22510.1 flagellar protein FlaG [Candidatus Nitrotoga sp. AM1P]
MLIPNISNTTQAQQPASITNDRLASNGKPDVVSPTPSVASELPEIAAQQVAKQQASATQLKNAVENINQMLQQANKDIEFSVDDSTKKSIIKVVDSTSGDLIRQFPSEEGLSLTRAIDRIQNGLLLTQKA